MATAGHNPIDLATINDVLTNYYIPRMWELIKVEAPGFARMGNLSDLVNWGPGKTGSFPVRTKAKRGMVGGTSGRLPKAGKPSYDMTSVDYTVFRQLIEFAWDAKLASTHERYIKNLLDMAIKDVKDEYLRRFNTYLYTKDNVIARLSADTAVDDTTCTVMHPWNDGGGANSYMPWGAQWLQEGDCVAFHDGDNNIVDYHTIASINRAAYNPGAGSGSATLTLGAGESFRGIFDALVNPGDAVSNVTVHHAAVHDALLGMATGGTDSPHADTGDGLELNDRNAGMLGIGNILDDDPYIDVPRDSFWKSVGLGNSGTLRALTIQLVDELLMKMNEETFTRPDMLIMNGGMWHEYADLRTAGLNQHQFQNQQTIPVGHAPGARPRYFTVRATEGQGDLEVLVDPYAPHNHVIAADSKELGYAEVYAMAEAKDDGSFLRIAGDSYDEWYGFFRWAGQFLATSPSSVGTLKDISQDIISL